MKLRSVVRHALLTVTLALLGLASGCDSNDAQCIADADCIDGQRCVLSQCAQHCQASGVCPSDQSCVNPDKRAAGPFCVTLDQCNDSMCLSGQRCVLNTCTSSCQTQRDCPVGKNCYAVQFDDGTTGNYCVVLDYAKRGRIGQNNSCQSDAECDTLRGWHCAAGKCRISCESHADCGPLGLCSEEGGVRDSTGNPLRTCRLDDKPRAKGQFGSACPNGPDECDTAGGFLCISAGPGDLNAYCTLTACSADSDCPSGSACELLMSSRSPCAEACGFRGQPNAPECIPGSEIGADRPFQCGPVSLLERQCRIREFCSPCESDQDCRGRPHQICAKDLSGAKICTVLCDPDANSCPWGYAASCKVWDQERGLPTCAHRYGSCVGRAKGCEPCLDQSECGPNGICLTATFTGERFCVTLEDSCSCDDPSSETCTGGGCPLTPGQLAATCYGGDVLQQSALYKKCVGANVNQNSFSAAHLGCSAQL